MPTKLLDVEPIDTTPVTRRPRTVVARTLSVCGMSLELAVGPDFFLRLRRYSTVPTPLRLVWGWGRCVCDI